MVGSVGTALGVTGESAGAQAVIIEMTIIMDMNGFCMISFF
jgi:hypothetical protein